MTTKQIATREFKTTQQSVSGDPQPPEGDGWMLGGAAFRGASQQVRGNTVYMYWQRSVMREVQVEA